MKAEKLTKGKSKTCNWEFNSPDVSKHDMTIVFISPDVKYGDNATITASVPADVPGNVRFIVDGTTYKVKIVSGKASVSIPNLKAGTHNVTATYAGNIKYAAATATATFNVNKHSPGLTVSAKNITYGSTEEITVSIAKDAPGNVRIYVDGTEYREKITSGKATLTLSGLSKGTYEVTVTYAGNVKYTNATATTTFKIY